MTTPDQPAETAETAEQIRRAYADYLAARIRGTADGLRATATRLDGLATEAVLLDPANRPGTAAALAQRAVSEVTWGVANAKPDAIVNAAADYDRVVAPTQHADRVNAARRLLKNVDPASDRDRLRTALADVLNILNGEAGA
jgi:hypothetical protein